VKKKVKNIAASARARLLERARSEGRPFNEILQYYAMERFLFRLSRTEHAGRFVLKGGLMLPLWGGPVARATRDIDLLGRDKRSVADLVGVMRECVLAKVPDDGLVFDPKDVVGEEIRLAARYDGVRVRCGGHLATARILIQIDVGFGDVVTPAAQTTTYSSLLDFEAPRLLATTPETAIAEKLEAIVVLDMANTRMKDFLDIWVLSEGRAFDGALLARAFDATFRRRRTPLPVVKPTALTSAFAASTAKQKQWRAYLTKGRIQGQVPNLESVVSRIASFAMPAMDALASGAQYSATWPPGGPWRREET